MEEYLPEFYHFFDAMRQNIEIFLQVGEEDEEQIHEILERDWEKAHAPLVGVQCYDFQESHPEAEAGTCVYFANLLTEIGRFFRLPVIFQSVEISNGNTSAPNSSRIQRMFSSFSFVL